MCNSYITSFLNKYQHTSTDNCLLDGRFWIGASDLKEAGNYRWLDGSQCCSQMWTDYQPDNFGKERCVHFWESGSKTGLNNNMCSVKLSFICQFKGNILLTP